MKQITEKLISRYYSNKRDLPWRKTTDPFKIWLSEIILQQTRVDQGLSYYIKFTSRFKTVQELAAADEEEVLKLWQGLGYYSRARNLHAAARQVTDDHGGKFPDTYSGLLKLKGVGPYTAAAVAAFAFNRHEVAVDGNVYRVFSRFFGIYTPINTPRALKEFRKAGESLMQYCDPAIFNQATMELGATVCKPVNPRCGECPLSSKCFAFGSDRIKSLPAKKKAGKVQKRYFYYLLIKPADQSLFLQLRTEKGIWRHLYQFPMIESETRLSTEELTLETANKLNVAPGDIRRIKEIGEERTHRLSHRLIKARFFEIDAVKNGKYPDQWKKERISRLEQYPVPVLIENFINEEKEGYFKLNMGEK